MDNEKLEKILLPRLEMYMSMRYELLPNVIGYETREQVGRIRHMFLKIYSNDHNPPHFHVQSNDKTVDAKFTLSDCKLLGGQINSKDIKRVEAFFSFMKNFMQSVWNKRNQ